MKERKELIEYILDNTTWTYEELEHYTYEKLKALADDVAEGYRLLKQGTYGRESQYEEPKYDSAGFTEQDR